MEFLKGVCPHCKGELQIPQDRDTIICMYCGKELSVKDALAQQEEVSRPTPVMDETVIEAMQNLLFGIENPMQLIKKALYMEFFNKYVFANYYLGAVIIGVFVIGFSALIILCSEKVSPLKKLYS